MRYVLIAMLSAFSVAAMAAGEGPARRVCEPTQQSRFICVKHKEECQVSCEKLGYCLSIQSIIPDCGEHELVTCYCWGQFFSTPQANPSWDSSTGF